MNEEKLREAKARALRMSEWAHAPDGLFAIFDAVEDNYFKTFKTSDIEDTALREKIYHRINALKDVRRAMEIVIAEGKGADAIIAKLSKANSGQRQPRTKLGTVNVA